MKKKKKSKFLLISIVLIVIAVVAYFCMNNFKINLDGIAVSQSKSEKYCSESGATVQKKERGDGKQYGVCIFKDGKQCEVDALYGGKCPVGGVSISGYITNESVYCAILGGNYKKNDSEGISQEKGSCSFFDGSICDALDLYDGKCSKGESNYLVYKNDDYNFSLNFPASWGGKYAAKEGKGDGGVKFISFDYNNANLFKIEIIPSMSWDNQADSIKKGYLGRNSEQFFALIQADTSSELSSDISKISQTFTITKPYVFSEKKEDSGSNYSIDVLIPSVGAVKSGQVDVELNSFVQGIIDNFKQSVGSSDAWSGNNTLKLFYDTYEINSNFVSIRFETETYNGGASSTDNSYSFNYDLAKDKVINLSDVFDSNKDYIKSLSDKSIQYLLKVNQEEPFTNDDWIKDGAGNKEANFQNFTFNKKTIVFYFDPGKVGSYAAGLQEIIFPLSSIKDIINQNEASALDFNF
jgi:putative hemolysin